MPASRRRNQLRNGAVPESMQPRINDFVIKIANVNGTGSASANGLLMKAIFRMGIPVVGKNFFPSNIQGLPTWFEIRVSREGYLARSGRVDIMVAMNAQTYNQDLADVSPGGYLLYDSTWPRDKQLMRDDITVIGIPLAQLVNTHFENVRARILMKNVCYVGALAALLDIDMAVIRQLIKETFGDKEKLIAGNLKAIELGYNYAKEHCACPLPSRLEPMQATDGHIMVDGNTMAGLGCMFAGATVGAWYPITPSTSLMDAFKDFCERYRVDKATGKHRYCIVQAEDELAAIGMVLGAAWNGARAFTPTSGPGISLMNEFIGFAYYSEIPAVLFDVQRVGPSTGMPTRTQQGDLLFCAYASHGDTRHVLLFPADPAECFQLAVTAFDLAERLQTPVFVMSDLDIGMNDWMVPKVKWDPDYVPDRGKVYSREQLESMQIFRRYNDDDGDGICYRTYPGMSAKGAYFTRGSGHNRNGAYTEDAAEYQDVLDRLRRKFDTAKQLVPAPVIRIKKGVKTAIVSLGSCDGAVHEALDLLAREGTEVNYLRVRAFPFNRQVEEFLDNHEHIFVVEQNRDAQLKSLLLLETSVEKHKLTSILHYGGMPIDAHCIVSGISAALAKGVAA
ncbi:MAG TPA: 2-oxoacid:acceptor oxidoreductase subunit alpha [Gammaproteobacteria bacterium]|nr:2-oxoacid:acceptor oxidoreductase subunit alpha [Gammaproteobacteria bacterium]